MPFIDYDNEPNAESNLVLDSNIRAAYSDVLDR